MNELRFDGKTAIVTGAGGNPSLGRAHALLLAARGANVVVNDIGSKHAPGPATAQSVVDEIVASGGKAVADANSVATEAGANAIIQTALDAFGGVDILVNNAGICINAAFDEITSADVQRTMDVNLMGPIWASRAAWPHMKKAGYGRVVNIVSGSMYGFALQAAYAASKGGVYSLTRAMATEGKRLGIKVNSIAPGAFTRMVIGSQEEDCRTFQGTKAHMPAEVVSPAVAFLAHEDCPVNGECFDVMAGHVRRIYMAQTPGISEAEITIEKIAARWDEVMAGTSPDIYLVGEFDGFQRHDKPYRPLEIVN
ncbi:NAD(P)-dependent dehydrogenase, short-chain alcohol dehydrogenase family [Novosphingobium sp. CF614]|uniref:SDR family NAD(P)-dependent oxidoreductase n=1 Tax=Novosphingobium sp. CF614 TaxID=1884364 RepID=UPI0008E986B1|nr:SDR family NAD(P)-dependent oxidoreductase [Novosphingobium sp. CF614]SFG00686.1 NAD(P)-dependent dehydrogenase, short-chain alcohol dehydrogenase family [Novosphingobium sp. CF614]